MKDFSRRSMLGGIVGIIAAPAIVRASSLMPIKVPRYVTKSDMRKDVDAVEHDIFYGNSYNARPLIGITTEGGWSGKGLIK